VAAAVAAGVPDLPDERLGLLVRWSLWAYGLDDRLDAPDATPERVAAIRDEVTGALAAAVPDGADRSEGGGTAGPDDAGRWEGGGIVGMLAELRGYGEPALVERFRGRLAESVTAAAELVAMSRRVAGGRPPPTVDGYLGLAGPDVYYRPYGLAVLALLEPPVTAADLDRCDRALEPAAVAVRLANDLRSIGRDRDEGQLNVLLLAGPDGTAITPAAVRRRITALVARHRRMLAPVRHATAAPVLVRSLRVAVGVYRHGDLR
jgi:hypothetical protein